jgi:AraC-like DNA-binding protein
MQKEAFFVPKKDICLRARFDSVMFFRGASARIASVRKDAQAELIVMLGGQYQARMPKACGGNTIEARSGDVVFWPENSTRSEENPPDAPPLCICIYFWWPHSPDQLPRIVHDREGLFRNLADRMLSVHNEQSPSARAICNGLLAGLLGEYIHLAGHVPKNLVEYVLRYGDEHMTERTRLDDLAQAIGLNKHHLGRKYKALTGRSLMKDLRQRKVKRAQDLLLIHSNRTLKDVAARTGIGDEHQLSRLLKRHTGLSVRALRQGAR